MRRITQQMFSLLVVLAVLLGSPFPVRQVAEGQRSTPVEEQSEREEGEADALLKLVRLGTTKRQEWRGPERPVPAPFTQTFQVRGAAPEHCRDASPVARVMLPRRVSFEDDGGGAALV